MFSRRQHVGAWVAGNQPNGSPRAPPPPQATTGPERLLGTTQDLFELLERVQSSRLDDQRCVLPPYFSQVSSLFCLTVANSSLFALYIVGCNKNLKINKPQLL